MFYRRHHRLILSALMLVIIASVVVGFEMAQSLMPAHADNLQVGTKWYFAEGRVGKGFREYFTISNPSSSVCAVQLQYMYAMDGSTVNSVKTVATTVNANSRATVSVNADLGIPDNRLTGATVSTVVDVNQGSTPTCNQVLVERPMYFVNFNGTSSGTDMIGVTDPSTTGTAADSLHLNATFYFADIPTGSAGSSWLSILNPQATSANVVVNYFAQGAIQNTQTLIVPPQSRGTIEPGNLNLPFPHIAAIVQSDQQILVERPSYFSVADGYNVSGAADIVGVPGTAKTWYFAEGQAQSITATFPVPAVQENLIIANPDAANDATVTITLRSSSGAASDPTDTQNYQVKVPARSQTIWNVNAHNNFTGATPDMSAEVTSTTGPNIIVQRQMYSTYQGTNTDAFNNQPSWSAQTVTDAFGATTPTNAYSFAEGYAATGYNEWLALFNTTGGDEHINVVLTNTFGHSYTQQLTLKAHSRYSDDITKLVQQNLIQTGEDNRAYAVSMQVTSTGGTFVAERSQYYHPTTYNVQGGSSVVGYTG
jgi:hypothetical protein